MAQPAAGATPLAAPLPEGPSLRHGARPVAGARLIAGVLRSGAFLSGGLFLVSLGLELLPDSRVAQAAVEPVQRAAAAVLLMTPVVRLVAAGASLGLRGEWRYALYAATVLGLLALAVGAGIHA